mgnify:CR=1 FL=1
MRTNPTPVSFLSFDVEALPGRAATDHIDRLIWGKFDGGEFGLRRICRILKEYRLKANFMLDFAMCALYGDKELAAIAHYLLEEGHEVHAHLHSEWLVRKWDIRGDWIGPASMDRLDSRLNEAFLDYLAFKYFRIIGGIPEVFRAGGFHFNASTIAAAGKAGFRALSNFNQSRHASCWTLSAEAANNEPFCWQEGLLELPVDISPEPLSSPIQIYEGAFDRAARQKKTKTFNLVLHATSLLERRDDGRYHGYSTVHEDNLHKICGHLGDRTKPMGYSEYLAACPPLPLLRTAECNAVPLTIRSPLLSCRACQGVYGASLKTGTCPCCGAGILHTSGAAEEQADVAAPASA